MLLYIIRCSKKTKKTFFYPFFHRSKISTAIKLEGGGGSCLNGPAIKRKTFFCGFPYLYFLFLFPFSYLHSQPPRDTLSLEQGISEKIPFHTRIFSKVYRNVHKGQVVGKLGCCVVFLKCLSMECNKSV